MRGNLRWAFLAIFLISICLPGFATEKEWTYLVFMNADNNLDPFADEDELLKDFYKKQVSQPIVADVQAQNLDSLRDFVKSASQVDHEIREYVKTQIQFLILVEGLFTPAFQMEVKQLLSWL